MSRLPSMAARNVGRNRRRSAVTAVAIIFGVTAVIVLRGFTAGAAKLMTDDVVEGRTGALQVHKKGYVGSIESAPAQLNMPHSKDLMARIAAVPNVRSVSGRIQFNGLIGNGRTQTMVVARGIDVLADKSTCPRGEVNVKEGTPLTPDDSTAATIGYELGESFSVKPGQPVNVQTQSPSGRANSMDLTVRGLTASSLPFENKRVMTVPLSTAQSLLGLEGRVTEYVVAVNDLDQLEQTAQALRDTLGDEYEVHTWKELQAFVRDVINRQNFVLGAIAVVLFVIVLTGIINTMLMSVFERVREIGTLLAVGVRRRQVMFLFVIEAAVIGIIGGLLGALVGFTAITIVGRIGIPIEMAGVSGKALLVPFTTPQFIALSVAVASLGAIAAGAWPAWRASRLNPVDALRNA